MKRIQKNQMKHKEKLDVGKIRLIDFLSFFMGFSWAMLAYVMSTYFSEAMKSDNVSIFYLIAYGVILVVLLNLHKLIRHFGKSFIFHAAFIVKVVAIVFLVILPVTIWGTGFMVLYMIANGISWVALDTILESFSKDSESGRIRGSHLAIMNAGFIAGPLLSSQILERFGFSGIFLVILIVHSVVLALALFGLRGTNHKFTQKISVKELLKKVRGRRNVMRIYYISFVMEAFYALMLAYVPIYLLSKGYTWEQLGIAFTIMLIPFVIVQYPVGIIADKKTGEKEILIAAIMIMGLSTLVFFLTNTSDILIWTIILFCTRIGVALIEVLRESYFYKRIDGSDVDVINFFKTSKPVAYVFSMLLATIVLFFFSIKAIFLLVALISFSALYPAFKLVDNRSRKEVLSRE
ncbi:MFS transporter [Patescibacteria group bacterium]